jgi:hypothetical protein
MKMRKLMFVILLVSLFVVPCFAEEIVTPRNAAEEYLESSTVDSLLFIGRAKKSPVLLAAAAELLGSNAWEVDTADGKINAASIYMEAINIAQEANDSDLVSILEKQSRILASRGETRTPPSSIYNEPRGQGKR